MPRKAPAVHPAYAAMLAESKRTGLPHTFVSDLTVHDRAWVEARDPALPFLWALRPDGTHTFGLEGLDKNGVRGSFSALRILDTLARDFEGSRFYLWNGVSLQGFESVSAARAGMLDLIEREAERAADLAARYCQSNPSTPHEWRGSKCCFCDVSRRETDPDFTE